MRLRIKGRVLELFVLRPTQNATHILLRNFQVSNHPTLRVVTTCGCRDIFDLVCQPEQIPIAYLLLEFRWTLKIAIRESLNVSDAHLFSGHGRHKGVNLFRVPPVHTSERLENIQIGVGRKVSGKNVFPYRSAHLFHHPHTHTYP